MSCVGVPVYKTLFFLIQSIESCVNVTSCPIIRACCNTEHCTNDLGNVLMSNSMT